MKLWSTQISLSDLYDELYDNMIARKSMMYNAEIGMMQSYKKKATEMFFGYER